MKKQKFTLQVRLLLIIGLLTQSICLLFGQYFMMSDFLRGLLQGLGLALMIMALVKQRRNNKYFCRSRKEEAYQRLKAVFSYL